MYAFELSAWGFQIAGGGGAGRDDDGIEIRGERGDFVDSCAIVECDAFGL